MSLDEVAKPFIKKFSHDGYFYIYDVNTNQVVEVEKIVYDIIDSYTDENFPEIESRYQCIYPSSQLRSGFEEIKKARKVQGLFSDFRPGKITMGISQPEQVKKMHEQGLNQLLLELTKDCTLECAYCNTSGKYADKRAHLSNMNVDTCLRAVDFFCQRSANSKFPFISFYGGEPLLKFDIIKETVQYVIKNYNTCRYGFNLTTNGAILNKEVIDFLSKYDFDILVSIDGPEKIHDRYRISRSGKSSFNEAMNNLQFLKQYNRDYFSRKVAISCVLAPPFEIDEILIFFTKHELFDEMRKRGKIRASFVDTRETSFIKDFSLEESIKEARGAFTNLVESLKKLILEKNLEKITIERNAIYHILINLARRTMKQLYEYMPPFGACHIGLKRLFVSTAGDFYICERVIARTKIGSIHSGFDYETIADYYRELDSKLADCKSCWALNHCERCWALIGTIHEFNGKIKEEFCSSSKRVIEIAFKAYTELLKMNPDSLKIFSAI